MSDHLTIAPSKRASNINHCYASLWEMNGFRPFSWSDRAITHWYVEAEVSSSKGSRKSNMMWSSDGCRDDLDNRMLSTLYLICCWVVDVRLRINNSPSLPVSSSIWSGREVEIRSSWYSMMSQSILKTKSNVNYICMPRNKFTHIATHQCINNLCLLHKQIIFNRKET